MADIKYEGKAVNRAVEGLTSVGNRFQPVSSQTKTKTGLMIGCKGFDKVAQTISNPQSGTAGFYSALINESEKNLSELVGQVRIKQTKIMEYSQTPQDDIDDFIDSLTTQEYYTLKNNGYLKNFDNKISRWAKICFGAENVFTSACTFVLSVGEGVLDFVESVGDTCITIVGSAASGVADLIGCDEAAASIDNWTRATVAYDVTGSAFDTLYAETEFGQYLQNNSTVFDDARAIGTGVGYAAGVIATSVFCPAVGMTAIAATAGFGNAAERAYADGATLGDGLVYSTASAAWEAAQWAVGGQIGKVGGKTLMGIASRVVLDGADSALEGFMQPLLTMTYKDYEGSTFAEQYGAAFNAYGGWDTVQRLFTTGVIMSGVSEAGSHFRSKRTKANIDGAKPMNGAVPEIKVADGATPDVRVDGAGTPDVRVDGAGTPEVLALPEGQKLDVAPDAKVEGGVPADANAQGTFAPDAKAAGGGGVETGKPVTEGGTPGVETGKPVTDGPGVETGRQATDGPGVESGKPATDGPGVETRQQTTDGPGVETGRQATDGPGVETGRQATDGPGVETGRQATDGPGVETGKPATDGGTPEPKKGPIKKVTEAAGAMKKKVDDFFAPAKKRIDAVVTPIKEVGGKVIDNTVGVALDYSGRVIDAMPVSHLAQETVETLREMEQHGFDDLNGITPNQDPLYGVGDIEYIPPTYEDQIVDVGPQPDPTPQYRQDPPSVLPPSGYVPPTGELPPIDIPPVDPTLPPVDPYNPQTPVDPYNPQSPVNQYNPGGGGGHIGSGYGGDNGFNGPAFGLGDEFGDDFDSIADIIAGGNKFGSIPTSSSPLRANGGGVSAFIPISAGLSAAAAVGLGTKALLDKKNKDGEDEEGEDDDLESWEFDEEDDSLQAIADEEDDEESFIPEELLLD